MVLGSLLGCELVRGESVHDSALLTFLSPERERAISRRELKLQVPPVRIRQFDPYYRQEKTYLALPLAKVLERGFRQPVEVLRTHEYVLTALDGYTVPLGGERLLEPGAHLAIADVDGPWEPIGPQRASPEPFYLVWSEAGQQDLATHPRPWALRSIAQVPFEQAFPDVVPADGGPGVFELFRSQCIRCHAINRQGGRVGPELNVPRNVTEYRELALLKEYIRNPLAFRYGNMPPFQQLSDEQLDDVLAYLVAMKEQKRDPGAGTSTGH